MRFADGIGLAGSERLRGSRQLKIILKLPAEGRRRQACRCAAGRAREGTHQPRASQFG